MNAGITILVQRRGGGCYCGSARISISLEADTCKLMLKLSCRKASVVYKFWSE